ncbi:hypothetical protein [Acetobacter sicerae]|uniref:hypothetical protein n=1 Tax=Acetobacter sicerae TaxID=85325 RepID=UPI00156AA5FA|nr:hypothetical protein [Acetobacter sicerae]NHN93531.1 hypothetical protein [Acetobacter sicerae]
MPRFTLSALPVYRLVLAHGAILKSAGETELDQPVTIVADTLPDIAHKVQEYGEKVSHHAPRRSFGIFIGCERGVRKPPGFETARRHQQLNLERWTHVIYPEPEHGDDQPGVRMWGSAETPFQIDGQPPFWRETHVDEFVEPAQGHLGFYGWLRAANAAVQRRTHGRRMVLDFARAGTLRVGYDAHEHPYDVVEAFALQPENA